MSQTVSLWGATYSDVPSIVVPSGNSTASFTDVTPTTAAASDVASGKYFFNASGVLTLGTASGGGTGGITQDANGYLVLSDQGGGGGGDSWSWMGKNPTKLQEWTETSTFADLGFDEWTYSTSSSATTLRAAQNLSPTVSVDVTQYDLVVLTKLLVTYDYGNWAPSSAMSDYALTGSQVVSGIFSTKNDLTSGTPGNYNGGSLYYDYKAFNWANNGQNTGFGSNQYGVYSSAAASSSSSGLTDLTVTVRTPVIYARGSTSYFTQTAFENVDMDKSTYKLVIEAWRVDRATNAKSFAISETANILNDGL